MTNNQLILLRTKIIVSVSRLVLFTDMTLLHTFYFQCVPVALMVAIAVTLDRKQPYSNEHIGESHYY